MLSGSMMFLFTQPLYLQNDLESTSKGNLQSLVQRCPRIFFRLPQMWRMNIAIRHILRKELK